MTHESERDVVVVTGATRGLGRATAEALASRGNKVVLSGRKAEDVNREVAILKKRGLDVQPLLLDVASDESVAAAVAALQSSLGRLDCLINNAGVILEGGTEFQTLPAALLAKTIDINAIGAFRTIAAFRPLLKASRNPRIVNVSSGMGVMQGMGGGVPAYRASKAALNVLTLQAHYALQAEGIRVLAVCPGWVRTDMGGANATRDLATGIAGIVWAAETPKDGPSGGFYRDSRLIPW